MNPTIEQPPETSGRAEGAAVCGEPDAAPVACFHCGLPCGPGAVTADARAFCCPGCRLVHDLLEASGLGRFYELGEHPGIQVRAASTREQWAFLDEEPLQRRLLDFSDGTLSRVTFHVPAMHCVACVWLLENLFSLHPGIGQSRVHFPRREVAITFSTARIKLSELVALLASIGYEPTLTLGELDRPRPSAARRRQWLQAGLAGFAFGNIMLLSVPNYLGLDSLSGPLFRAVFGYLSLALALPVLLYSAADYWRSAFLSFRQRILTLDVPIALGLLALYGQSAFEILSGRGEGYLDSLSGLVFFLLCGRAFQQMTHERLAFDRDFKSFFPLSVRRRRRATDVPGRRAAGETEALVRASPHPDPLPGGEGERHPARGQCSAVGKVRSTAAGPASPGGEVRDEGGSEVGVGEDDRWVEEQVALSDLRVGDRLWLRHRELIPADARLVRGPALIDYSFVTGESAPVPKQEGDYVYAGGQQIGSTIEVETVKPVSQSYLASLWNHEAFQKPRGDDLDSLTNRYSRHFTVIVIGVAVAAACGWGLSGDVPRGIKAFTSVLIVACPCALALAAPFALGTAQRWLARLQVFVRNTLVLERLAQVEAIVFDKTGTLTAARGDRVSFQAGDAEMTESGVQSAVASDGMPEPVGGPAGSGLSPAEACWVRSLAGHSTHPHAARLSGFLADGQTPVEVEFFQETPGSGLEGEVEGHVLRLGSRAWLAQVGVSVPAWSPPSGSGVWLAIDGRYRGVFWLRHPLRPETSRLVRRLAERYALALLSGDNAQEQPRFRDLFGREAHLRFNQSPLEKLAFIQGWQREGKVVMMVGDGLNDAGALRQSDVGVAVVEDIGAFSPASDVILEALQVPRLWEILDFARGASRVVRASFALSALYNLVGISIAAAGVLSPVICAVLMPVSSISVVLFACGAATWAARRAGFLGRP